MTTQTTIKRFLISILFFTMGQTFSAQTHVENCSDTIAPESAERFGTVSFVSNQEWTIVGDFGITQIWSDAVHATACDKTNFAGDSASRVFLVDCRSNHPDFPGSLFSWCAVAKYGSVLCPEPWRVPTDRDFCDLNKALFGIHTCHTHTVDENILYERLVGTWGGVWGGATDPLGTALHFGGQRAYYWSQTKFDGHYAIYFFADQNGNVQPQCISNSKDFGGLLRCVR
jgi:uncharacterized protein (TIGR02145 family)